MQACAESPVVFLNQMLESLNASVQELKRSDLLRLPFAQPLRVGAGCKGQREQELLQEERLSSLWHWPGMEKIVMKAMEDEVEQQRRQQQPPTVNERYNGAAYSVHALAGMVEQDMQQPKQKKQKKSDDLTKLDPSQALQNLMTGGQINTKLNVNSTPSAEQHSSAGRHSAHHELQAQQMNGNSSSINLVPSVVSSLASLQQRSALTMHGSEMPAYQQHASHKAPGAYLQLPSLQEKLSQERREQEQRTLEGQLQLQLREQLQLGQLQQQLREQKQTEQQLRELQTIQEQTAQQLRDVQTIKEHLKDKELQKMQARLRLDPQLEQQLQGNPQMQQQIMGQIDRVVEEQVVQIYQAQLQPTNNTGAGSSWAV